MRFLPAVAAALAMLAAALTAACSTAPTPGVCCIGTDDCSRLGLTEDRPCPSDQACVDFTCVAASCSNLGCPAEAPVCDATTDACRGCRVDAECPSGACADDGTCVAEADVVYLHPDGSDAGACTRDAPCNGLQFGARQTSDGRNHIVMAPGLYEGFQIGIGPPVTLAQQLFIHGSGATLENASAEPLLGIGVPTTIRDLEISSPLAQAITLARPCVFERLKVRALSAFTLQGHATIRDSTILTAPGGTGIRLRPGGSLTWERGVIQGGLQGIATEFSDNGDVEISNLLVFGTSQLAINLPNTITGSISFSTVADSGMMTPTGPRSVVCSSFLEIRSSIIWDIGSSAQRPALGGGCTLVSTIVGASGVPGAINPDPRFVDPTQADYHLNLNSPARDMVDSGPALDFEGDLRPRGARFDVGADEAP